MQNKQEKCKQRWGNILPSVFEVAETPWLWQHWFKCHSCRAVGLKACFFFHAFITIICPLKYVWQQAHLIACTIIIVYEVSHCVNSGLHDLLTCYTDILHGSLPTGFEYDNINGWTIINNVSKSENVVMTLLVLRMACRLIMLIGLVVNNCWAENRYKNKYSSTCCAVTICRKHFGIRKQNNNAQ